MTTHGIIEGKGLTRLIPLARIAGAFPWIAERLHNRPDSEHELTINRLMLSGLTIVYLLTASSLGNASADNMLHNAGLLVAFYWIFSLALLGHILNRPGVSVPRRLFGMVVDFCSVSYYMHCGGEALAPLYPIYLWAIFGYGFRFGLSYLAAASACGVLSFAGLVLTTEFWRDHPAMSVGFAGGLILLPLYVSSLIRKLSHARRQAEEASKAKSHFLASVSHELRTPLNAIIGLSELMRDTKLDAEQMDMTQTIGQSGRTLLNLINTILDFSRIEAGRVSSQVGPFDLFALLDSVRRLLLVQARAKDLRLALHVTARTPQFLIGDRSHIEEILVNLAGNAVKFTATGHVVIAVDTVVRTGNCVRLRVEVTDTGIGIAEEAQQRIFESFTQANEKIIDQFGGTGLGLAIVKQLVELHGGTIGIVSAPEQGSLFWFELDLDAEAAETDAMFSEPVVLLSASATTRAVLRASLPNLHIADTEEEAATLLESALRVGTRQPIAILELPVGATAARAVARRLAAGDHGSAALLIAVSDNGQVGMLPEPARSLFVTALPQPISHDGIGAVMAIAKGCHQGASMLNVAALPATVPNSGASILLAEDNRTNQKVICKILEKDGHIVTIAENGEAALDALHNGKFDLALMDVNMPLMTGIEATKLYRFGALGQKHLPILALTADASAEVSDRCKRAGMDACLTKPIEPAHLMAAVSQFVPERETAWTAGSAETLDAQSISAEVRQPMPTIEFHKLDELRRLGGAEFVDDLVQQFLDDSIGVLRKLADAVHGGDVDSFRDQAHALRSGAANVGARGIYEMCLAWRKIDEFSLRTEGEAHVDELKAEFERVRGALPYKAAA